MIRNILYTPLKRLPFLIKLNFHISVWDKVGPEWRLSYVSEKVMGRVCIRSKFRALLPG